MKYIMLLSMISLFCSCYPIKDEDLYRQLLVDIYSYHSCTYVPEDTTDINYLSRLDTLYVEVDDSAFIYSPIQGVNYKIGYPTLTRKDKFIPVYTIERISPLSFAVWEGSYGYFWMENEFICESGGGFVYKYKRKRTGYKLQKKIMFWI